MLHETIRFKNWRDNILYSSAFQTLYDDPLEGHKIILVGHD